MAGTKVSVSPDEDIEFIDDYADAFAEWEESCDARAWEPVVGDGLG
jgi:hypothetical protein